MKRLFTLALALMVLSAAYAQNDINQQVLSSRAEIDEVSREGKILIGVFKNRDHIGSYDKTNVRVEKDKDSDSLLLLIGTKNIWNYKDFLRRNDYYIIRPDSQTGFVEAMNLIQEKYSDWSEVAKQNQISEFQKDFPIDNSFIVYEYDSYTMKFKPAHTWAWLVVDKSGNASVAIEITMNNHPSYYFDFEFTTIAAFNHFVEIIQPDYVQAVYDETVRKIEALNKAEQQRDELFK